MAQRKSSDKSEQSSSDQRLSDSQPVDAGQGDSKDDSKDAGVTRGEQSGVTPEPVPGELHQSDDDALAPVTSDMLNPAFAGPAFEPEGVKDDSKDSKDS